MKPFNRIALLIDADNAAPKGLVAFCRQHPERYVVETPGQLSCISLVPQQATTKKLSSTT